MAPHSTRQQSHVGMVGAAALVALAVACSPGGRSAPAPGTSSDQTSTSAGRSGQSSAGAAESLQQAFVSVVAKARPQVVQISTAGGLGSGVIYDEAGDIVTNAHVVGTATSFTVQLVTGQQLSATLVGRYLPDDLAVIKVSGAAKLSPATFGDSGTVQVGEFVFAVGNPLGLSSSVTEGIVSYNGRSVSEGGGIVLPSTIQTSAPINPGNSGGALVDLNGDVIGIPTLAATDQQLGGSAAGLGFAVPASTVKLIVPQLIASGRVTRSDRAALGVSAADAVDLSGRPAGAVVVQVAAGGSAAASGVTPGDVITAVEGKAVTSLADLTTVLAQLAPGQHVTVKLIGQNGVERTVTAVLGELGG